MLSIPSWYFGISWLVLAVSAVVPFFLLFYTTQEEVEVHSVEYVDHGPPGTEDYIATAVRGDTVIRASMRPKDAEEFTKKKTYTLHVRRLVFFEYELSWLIQ